MALTIESVCTGLVSSRIRDRNESLLALEEILVPFPKGMPAKQAAALLSLLFRLIEIEKVFYLKATTTAVELRLSRACSGISTIIQSSIDPTNKVELKYKHYLSVLNEIVNLLIVSTTRTLLWPCAFAFLHIFSTVIRQRLVKNHFGTIEWRRVFVFVTKVIQALQAKQTVNGTAGYEDNLLGELMSCLCTLLDADTPSSTVYLPLLLPSDKLYFALLPILGQAVNDIKKEGAVAVALMKVINKLIVVLSTEDIHFVNKLVIMGVRLLLQFATTKLTTLQYQVLIFLNLNGVHDYMFWDDVPDPLVSDSDRDRDISIRSESDTEDHIGENRKNIVMERSILQYNIETLILTLMSMENQPFYQLKPRDVGMHAQQPRHTIDPSWFVLRTIHLASHDEGTEMSWMLISGLTRLAGTYYRFMLAQNNRSTSVTPEPSRHHKRQKLDSFQKALVGSSDTVDMVCKLLEFAAIADARRLALKLLAFHLQQRNWTSITGDRPEDGKNLLSVFNKDESSTSLFASDSGLNISYDLPWSGTPHTHSRIAVARMVLSTFDTTNVNVWVLLAIKSILEDQAVLSGALTHTLYSQLLRLIIPLVSHPTNELVVNLSTDLVHQIVVDLGVRVNKVVDSTLIVQLDNLVSMSEVSGPALVNVWSFHFWYAVYKVINYTNLSKKDDVQERVQKWLISKWSQVDHLVVHSVNTTHREAAQFLCWLCGVDIMHLLGTTTRSQTALQRRLHYEPLSELCDAMDKRHKLEFFIVEKTGYCPNDFAKSPFHIDVLGKSDSDRSDPLMLRLIQQYESHFSGLTEVKLAWTLFMASVFFICRHLHPLQVYTQSILTKCTQANEDFTDCEIPQDEVLDILGVWNRCDRGLSADMQATFNIDWSPLYAWIEVASDANREVNSNAIANECAPESLMLPGFDFRDHILEFLLQQDLLKAFPAILQLFENTPLDSRLVRLCMKLSYSGIAFTELPSDQVRRFLRILGEGPLSSQEFERAEETLITVSVTLTRLLPLYANCNDEELKKDWLDMATWLLQCGEKGLLQSEKAVIEYLNFTLLAIGLDRIYEDAFSNRFRDTTNHVRVSLTRSLVKVFCEKGITFSDQVRLYKRIYQHFEDPQQSTEQSATYCLFFASLISDQISSSLLTSAIYNLVEYSRFTLFTPYAMASIASLVCVNIDNGKRTPKEIFKSLKVEMVSLWWSHNHSIEGFPFELFGYSDLRSMIDVDYKELTSVALSSSFPDEALVDQIARVKRTDVNSVVADSFGLIVSLAYTDWGSKNAVHASLKQNLGASYTEYVATRLPLIVLEVIKFMDVSNETLIQSTSSVRSPLFNIANSQISNPPSVSIPFRTATDLMASFIRKKYDTVSTFWQSKTIQYFLIRRLLLDLSSGLTSQQKQFDLRRIKTILLWGSPPKEMSTQLKKLLVGSLCPQLADHRLQPDICQILSSLKVGSRVFERLILVELLYGLSQSTAIDVNYVCVLDSVECQPQDCVPDTATEVLQLVVAKLKDKSSPKGLAKFLQFMKSDAGYSQCQVNGSFKQIIYLLAKVFSFETDVLNVMSLQPDIGIVRKLVRIEGCQFREFPTGFTKWCASYLAAFYLEGGSKDQASTQQCTRFGNNHLEMSLTSIIGQVIDMYGQLGENADASIEAILGVLIWKYDLKSPDLHQNLDFKEWYLKFQTYILPIDFHMCVLLHENVNLTVPIYSLTELLEADSSLGLTYDMQAEWVKNLFMALTVALARFTSVAPLLSALAVNVPSLTTKVLPNLICLYIELSVEDGVATTSRLMHWLIDQELSESLAALVIDIILCIREGAKSNKTGFKEVYSTLNIRQAFRFAASSKFEAASLMLLEDATCLLEEDERKQCLQEETKILQSVYELININDLIYGLPMEPSLDYAMNILEHNSSNLKSIRFDSSAYDTTITLSSTLGQHSARLIQSLMANGHVGMAKSIGDSVQSEELSMAFEWAWKLGTWDVPIPATVENESIILYKTLKQIRDYPSQLGEICAESCLSILSTKEQESHWLRALASTASVHSIFSSYNRGSLTTDVQRFENKTHWFEENHDLEAAENILQSRRAAFQILQSHHGKADNIGEQIWLNAMSELARYNHTSEGLEQNLQKRLNSTMLLSRISDSRFSTAATSLRESVKIASQFQSACTLWSQGETTISVAILKELRVELQKHGCDEMQSDLKGQRCLQVSSSIVNALLVKWMSESRQELPATIMSYYIVPTVKELSPSDLTASEVFKIFARFCEKQFTSLSFNEKLAKVNSLIESRKAEILQLKTHFHRKAVNPVEKVNIQKYYLKLKAQYNLDLQELETLAQSKSELSERAVEFYLLSISANYILSRVDAGVNEDHYNEDVDKFFALWLEFSAMESLNKKIRQNMLSLPNHLLVGWCPQLISRITSEQTEFQKSLHLLILQVCESHPFHSLYNLFSLTRHESSSKLNPTSTIAARAIWSQLKSNSKVGPTLVDVEKFCDESIILAETKTSATKGRSFFLDKYRGTKTDFAWWLSNLPHLPPPTLNLRIDLSMSYKDVPRFEHIEPKIDIAASGLSLPKIATFHLSDGSVHKVLFKHGSDDLRQDSIMEQVFEKVNQMFCKDKETRNRELTVRTYRAIPLGPQNGLIEFIPNSIALIDVIRPYHTLLDKMKLETAREKMKKCQSSAKANRIETYDDISRKIKPVMRHWFLDHFITPESWFRSKTMYTRGIASSSIVGYILGLGDRHCNNVLLDKVTGEPIHIDLGVAFDQGKMLPIPETVPFRLTRDIVDGFGITGVEGIFRKSCEHSYRVMKQNKDHVMAILDVLRWDPLYSWSLSPLRKVRLQEDDQTSGEVVIAPLRPHEDGSEAGRAISRVSDKLNGGGLSIEATVRELIQDATSKENLAVIYCGWCPFF